MENIAIDSQNLQSVLQVINELIIPDEFDLVTSINREKLEHLTGTLAAAQLLATKLNNEVQEIINKNVGEVNARN